MREKGLWRFLLSRGMLVFGLLFGALNAVWSYLSGGQFGIVRLLVTAVVAGLVFGVLLWSQSERRYHKRHGN